MTYRKEIDGLRAIAVWSVIFYHAGFSGFPGGFLGVDVFFVISGFLISSLALREYQNWNTKNWSIFERRTKRICSSNDGNFLCMHFSVLSPVAALEF